MPISSIVSENVGGKGRRSISILVCTTEDRDVPRPSLSSPKVTGVGWRAVPFLSPSLPVLTVSTEESQHCLVELYACAQGASTGRVVLSVSVPTECRLSSYYCPVSLSLPTMLVSSEEPLLPRRPFVCAHSSSSVEELLPCRPLCVPTVCRLEGYCHFALFVFAHGG